MNEQSIPSDPKHEELIFNALAGRVNTEITTYWARSNVLLVVNAGLLAVGFNRSGTDATTVPICLVGIVAAIILWFVVIRGRAWLRYWENKLRQFDQQLGQPTMYDKYWDLPYHDAVAAGRPGSVTNWVLYVPPLVIVAWLVLFIRTL
jgi:hypothetical protein